MTADDVWNAQRMPDGSTVISFPQPGPLLNMNDRMHYRSKARIVAQWRKAAHQAALVLGPPAKRKHGASWVQIDVPVRDHRRRDPSNLTPLTKATVDGLVDAGLWPDDTPEFVTTLEPAIHVDRPKGTLAPIVRIVITPRTGATP